MYFNPEPEELERFNAALGRMLTPRLREQMCDYSLKAGASRPSRRVGALSRVLARELLQQTGLAHCFVRPELTLGPRMRRAAAERELAGLITSALLAAPRPEVGVAEPPLAS